MSIPGTTPEDSRAFTAALEALDAEGVRRAPKADLHNHGVMGMRYASLRRIAPEAPPPLDRYAGLAGFLRWTGGELRLITRDRARCRSLYEASIEDAIADGVAVLEMSFDTNVGRAFGGAAAYAALAAELVGKYRGRVELRPEIGIKKAADPRAEGPFAAELIGSGAFKSIDLYGAEVHPWFMGKWRKLYRLAAAKGLKLKAHAGEIEGPFGWPRLAAGLGLDALQHGIGLVRSKRALAWARETRIACNVCPASNVALGAVPSWEAHPVKRMLDAGLRVTLATDDLLCFGVSASEQYLELRRRGVLDSAELDAIRVAGLEEGFGAV